MIRRAARDLHIDLSCSTRLPWTPSARQLKRWALAALPPLRRPATLSVRIVGLARSRSLNVRYRRKDKPTNVLSFTGAGNAPDGRFYLGELVICATVVAREAGEQKKKLLAHWAHLTVHGVLHLCGFDHEREPEAGKMETREIQILDRLGFSNPYL